MLLTFDSGYLRSYVHYRSCRFDLRFDLPFSYLDQFYRVYTTIHAQRYYPPRTPRSPTLPSRSPACRRCSDRNIYIPPPYVCAVTVTVLPTAVLFCHRSFFPVCSHTYTVLITTLVLAYCRSLLLVQHLRCWFFLRYYLWFVDLYFVTIMYLLRTAAPGFHVPVPILYFTSILPPLPPAYLLPGLDSYHSGV